MIEDILLSLKADIEMLKTAFGNSLKVGAVDQVDPVRGVRVNFGSGASRRYLSPWYPHPDSGGLTKTWVPLSKGQIVGVINPGGDPRQGFIVRAGFSGNNRPPSQDLAKNKYTFGNTAVMVDSDGLTIAVANSKIRIDGDGIRLNGKEIHLNG